MMDFEQEEPPLSFDSLNIKTRPNRIRHTFLGKIRSFSDISVFEWVYLSVSLLALITSFGLSMERLLAHELDSSDFTFAILLLLTIVFCCYYVANAVLTERGDELLVFVISNIIVLIYCIMNYLTQKGSTIKLVRLIVVCVFSPFLIGIGIVQSVRYLRSNNLIFNTVGGTVSLQKTCRKFFFCSSLLKFDLQLQLSMLILVMDGHGSAMNFGQKIILASGIPIAFIFIALGFLGLRHENHIMMSAFYIIGLSEPAYIAYKFYYAATYERDNNITFESTFACGFFALIVWITLMVLSCHFLVYDFGKGLKEKMYGNSSAPSVVPAVPDTS